MKLYTIGHSNHSQEEFLHLVKNSFYWTPNPLENPGRE